MRRANVLLEEREIRSRSKSRKKITSKRKIRIGPAVFFCLKCLVLVAVFFLSILLLILILLLRLVINAP